MCINVNLLIKYWGFNRKLIFILVVECDLFKLLININWLWMFLNLVKDICLLLNVFLV